MISGIMRALLLAVVAGHLAAEAWSPIASGHPDLSSLPAHQIPAEGADAVGGGPAPAAAQPAAANKPAAAKPDEPLPPDFLSKQLGTDVAGALKKGDVAKVVDGCESCDVLKENGDDEEGVKKRAAEASHKSAKKTASPKPAARPTVWKASSGKDKDSAQCMAVCNVAKPPASRCGKGKPCEPQPKVSDTTFVLVKKTTETTKSEDEDDEDGLTEGDPEMTKQRVGDFPPALKRGSGTAAKTPHRLFADAHNKSAKAAALPSTALPPTPPLAGQPSFKGQAVLRGSLGKGDDEKRTVIDGELKWQETHTWKATAKSSYGGSLWEYTTGTITNLANGNLEAFQMYAVNKGYMAIHIDFSVDGLKGVTATVSEGVHRYLEGDDSKSAFRWTVVLPARQPGKPVPVFKVLQFVPVPGQGYSYCWPGFKWGFGDPRAKPDLHHQYLWPVKGLARVTQGYFGSFSHTDNAALDLAGADGKELTGEPVYAMRDGVVWAADYSNTETCDPKRAGSSKNCKAPAAANVVRVLHDDGSWAAYVHLEPLKKGQAAPVKAGQAVVEGETALGTVGNTGYSTGPHLHIEWDYASTGKDCDPQKVTTCYANLLAIFDNGCDDGFLPPRTNDKGGYDIDPKSLPGSQDAECLAPTSTSPKGPLNETKLLKSVER